MVGFVSSNWIWRIINNNFCECKVDMTKFNTKNTLACVLEWYVIRHASKISHQKDICLKEIRVHVQNMLFILSSIVNMTLGGNLYDCSISKRIFTLIMNKIFIWVSKIILWMTTCTIWIFQSNCNNCMFPILQEAGAKRKESI